MTRWLPSGLSRWRRPRARGRAVRATGMVCLAAGRYHRSDASPALRDSRTSSPRRPALGLAVRTTSVTGRLGWIALGGPAATLAALLAGRAICVNYHTAGGASPSIPHVPRPAHPPAGHRAANRTRHRATTPLACRRRLAHPLARRLARPSGDRSSLTRPLPGCVLSRSAAGIASFDNPREPTGALRRCWPVGFSMPPRLSLLARVGGDR